MGTGDRERAGSQTRSRLTRTGPPGHGGRLGSVNFALTRMPQGDTCLRSCPHTLPPAPPPVPMEPVPRPVEVSASRGTGTPPLVSGLAERGQGLYKSFYKKLINVSHFMAHWTSCRHQLVRELLFVLIFMPFCSFGKHNSILWGEAIKNRESADGQRFRAGRGPRPLGPAGRRAVALTISLSWTQARET